MSDIGYATLVLALIFATYSAIVSTVNIRIGSSALAISARNGLIAVCVFYTLAIEIMLYALITDDFDLRLVATYSSTDTPLIYKLMALYSDKAGSLMFWGWLMSIVGLLLVFQKRQEFKETLYHFTGILSFILMFFLILVTMVLDVFEGSPDWLLSLPDGLGRVYQHPGMAIHPPLLFLGFAGFAVVFAFTMSLLIHAYRDDNWIGAIRRWVIFSWCALGLANLVGAWWAWDIGEEWGGYWFWDQVENAGLMPWLLGTALLHLFSIGRKKGFLNSWIIPLTILTFIFTLLSPFITHGGFDDSIHTFADSPIPPYVLSFMFIVLIGTFGLFFSRRGYFKDRTKLESIISCEGAFLSTTILFGLIVLVVLIGTAIPGIAHDLGKNVIIERNFFDWTAGPALLLLVLLMGICPLLGWHRSTPGALRHNFSYPVLISTVAAIVVLASGVGNWYALAALICGLPLLTILQEWYRGIRVRYRTKREPYPLAFASLIWNNRPRYGGFIVHIGIILITIGVIGSSLNSDDCMVNLIWTGGGVLLIGGTIAFWPDRNLTYPASEVS